MWVSISSFYWQRMDRSRAIVHKLFSLFNDAQYSWRNCTNYFRTLWNTFFFCSSALLIFAHTKSIHMFMTWNQTRYFRGFIILAGMPSFSCQFPTNHQEKSIFLLKTIQFLEHVLSNEHEHLQASNCCLVFRSHKLSISAPITVPCTQCASEEIESIMQSLAKL